MFYLQTDRSRVVEGRSYLCIHLDAKISVLDDRSVTLIDALADPANEWFAGYSGEYINDPLFWNFSKLLGVW